MPSDWLTQLAPSVYDPECTLASRSASYALAAGTKYASGQNSVAIPKKSFASRNGQQW